MRKSPFFSVVIPVYNRKHRIGKAIQSMLDQSFQDWELLLIDDASSDGSFEYMKSFKDSRVNVFQNQTNQERCRTRNRGIELASGQYIAFLDSDDYHLPQHYQELYEAIEAAGFPKAFFFTNAWNETEEGERSERLCPPLESMPVPNYFLRHTVNPQRWAVHADLMREHPFDPNIQIAEDMETSLRICFSGAQVHQIPKRTTVYVAASDSFTHGASNKWERELDALKKIFKKPAFKGKLPKKETRRLISMCYFHLAIKAFQNQESTKVLSFGLRSFFLCPAGYNRKTNKPLFVALVYNIPLIGPALQKIKSKA